MDKMDPNGYAEKQQIHMAVMGARIAIEDEIAMLKKLLEMAEFRHKNALEAEEKAYQARLLKKK